MRKSILFMCGCLVTSLLMSCEDTGTTPPPPLTPSAPEEPTTPSYYAPPVARKLSFNVSGEVFNFNYIDSALFLMGSSSDGSSDQGSMEYGSPHNNYWVELGRGTEAQHPAKLTEYHYMGTHEVTNAQFHAIMGYYYVRKDPEQKIGGFLTSRWERNSVKEAPPANLAQQPAVFVSWAEADLFVTKMSEVSGQRFRLPYEAEWEFACRGIKGIEPLVATEAKVTAYVQKKEAFNFIGSGGGISAIDACYNTRFVYADKVVEDPHAVPPTDARIVGSYRPNGFGLYDMHGNVGEWVSDTYENYLVDQDKDKWATLKAENIDYKGSSSVTGLKVYRGGGWDTNPVHTRSAARGYSSFTSEYSHQVGFRIAHSPAFRALKITKITPTHATIEAQCNLVDIKKDQGRFGFVFSSEEKMPTIGSVNNDIEVVAQKQVLKSDVPGEGEDLSPRAVDAQRGVVRSVIYSDPSFDKSNLRFNIEIAFNPKTTYYVRSFHEDINKNVTYDDVYYFETPPFATKTIEVNGIQLDFTLCYPDTVSLGSSPQENLRKIDEKSHWVIIPKYYYISTTEVTADQWSKIMTGESAPIGGNYPVANVSWYDVVDAFLPKINDFEKKDVNVGGVLTSAEVLRLPTEAEWEYASRGRIVVGEKDRTFNKPFSNKVSGYYNLLPKAQARYDWRRPYSQINPQTIDDTEATPIAAGPVKQYAQSASGLYDIHGNVAEWCSDWYAPYPDAKVRKNGIKSPKGPAIGENRIVRGGAYDTPAEECRSAYRSSSKPDVRSPRIGFRLVLEIP